MSTLRIIAFPALVCLALTMATWANEPQPAKPAAGPAAADRPATPPKPAPEDPAQRRYSASVTARDKADRMRGRYEADHKPGPVPAAAAKQFDEIVQAYLAAIETDPVGEVATYCRQCLAGAYTFTGDFDAALRIHIAAVNVATGPLEQIKALPKQEQNVKHICIEGWDVIGNFGGVRLAEFLQFVGADPAARFVEVGCLDDYYSSYDIESCLHPQTLLCYEMYGQPLANLHGAPLRIHMPVKLGYKSAKYIYLIRVSNVLRKEKGFWEDQGYSWHGGI